MSLYNDEFLAEVNDYVLWCEARLQELREKGLVSGERAITESGMASYRELVRSGFRPSRDKVVLTLRGLHRFTDDDVNAVTAMLMNNADGITWPVSITWTYCEASEQWPVRCSLCGAGITDIYWVPYVDEHTDPDDLAEVLAGSPIGEFGVCDECYGKRRV